MNCVPSLHASRQNWTSTSIHTSICVTPGGDDMALLKIWMGWAGMRSLTCTHSAAVPKVFALRLDRAQPSQLYVSTLKLARVHQHFDLSQPECIEPVPVARLCGKTVYTDGHTRAFAAFSVGLTEVPAYWDEDELDWAAYGICVRWCARAGIHTIADLGGRVVSPDAYQDLWLDRCARMHRWLEVLRNKAPLT